jgi:uncharacterized protein YecE (DUF72 family)
MQIWVGTSGYSYPDWVGGFYPAGTRPGRMLEYYCRHFPLVELNFTFYRPPSADMLARLASQTPEGFQFLVKMPRTISHEQSNEDLPGFQQALTDLQRRSRLQGVLCQLPQATHNTADQRRWLDGLIQAFGEYRLAVEFRHRSWFHPEVTAWLVEKSVTLVSVDAPDLPGLYPTGLMQSGSLVYVRLHSRRAANWYKSDKDRYDYNYSDAELGEWIDSIRGSAAERALLLFNNCQRSHAVVNAQRLRELLLERGGEMEVIAPFAAPRAPTTQRLLFE